MTSISFCLISHEGGDVVLRARDQVDRQKPLDERRARLVEDGPGPRRGLHATPGALEDPPRRRIAVLGLTAVGAYKAVRPTRLDECSMALLIGAILPVEVHEAQPLLELDRIARH